MKPAITPTREECYFYHTFDIPGMGVLEGEWDLRENIDSYLGNTDFRNKRVLDVGTANGCLAFHMEKKGAEVIGYDLDPSFTLDIAPSRYNSQRHEKEHKSYIRHVNNGFWFVHSALHSNVRMHHGTVYDIPEHLAPVDISVFGSVLLHLRDPFLALKNAIRITKETCIVTEPVWSKHHKWLMPLVTRLIGPYQIFAVDYQSENPQATWWNFTPGVIQRYLGALGFDKSTVTYHHQFYKGTKAHLFTVVATRTQPLQAGADR